MIEIFHAPGTRGYRAIWTCEELGLAYKVTPVDMAPAFRASAPWRELSPTGKVPVMRDGATTMYESCAMVQYLVDAHGKGQLMPALGTPEHALYLQWGWFSEATFARPLGEIVNHRRAFGANAQTEITDEMAARGRLCAQAVDAAVARRRYLLGDEFSAADIMMGYSVRIFTRLVDEPLSANLQTYWEALQARPAFAATERADAGAVLGA
ncbi:MAG: glutathione S-transferase [Gammaproteobacteria bacterium]|jgi:glutathione S-transferase